MNIQIFGTKKNFDSKKAERYFKERGIKYQFIDMKEKGLSKGEVVWQCRNCGFIFTGKEAPEVCPACLHPQAYFEVKKENY